MSSQILCISPAQPLHSIGHKVTMICTYKGSESSRLRCSLKLTLTESDQIPALGSRISRLLGWGSHHHLIPPTLSPGRPGGETRAAGIPNEWFSTKTLNGHKNKLLSSRTIPSQQPTLSGTVSSKLWNTVDHLPASRTLVQYAALEERLGLISQQRTKTVQNLQYSILFC